MKNAFTNADGVLISWGYAESNNDDTLIEVADDFDLEPGKWRYSGGEWVAYVAPPPVPTADEVRAERSARMAEATAEIDPLRDLVDLGEATPDDEARLQQWVRYRVTVSKVQDQPGFPGAVVWPARPA